MSWQLLERFLESEHFNNDPSLAVAYLSRYANHVGIQYVLCSKLRRFSYEEIEFFLPQLCHLLVSVTNESMALEEFIIDLCQESVSGALITFWLFQTHLHDLSNFPNTESFRVCRRVFNKVQNIVFGAAEPPRPEKIHENVLPTTVLASIILAGVAVPFFPREVGPLAIAQARKPRPLEETISEAPPVRKVSRSHTVSGADRPGRMVRRTGQSQPVKPGARPKSANKRPSHPPSTTVHLSSSSLDKSLNRRSTSSLPDVVSKTAQLSLAVKDTSSINRTSSPASPLMRGSDLSRIQKIGMLRAHYFRSETQFLSALEGISNRLVVLPKPARLSALRAELALVARDLPAEVDIPLLCPATLIDGIPSQSRHHRIVRINPAEATSLNSAERVPYLLMLEVLREDFDFNPESESNQRLLSDLITHGGNYHRRLFDITAASQRPIDFVENGEDDSLADAANGDLSSPSLLRELSDGIPSLADLPLRSISPSFNGSNTTPRTHSPYAYRSSSPNLSTPPLEQRISRSGSPAQNNARSNNRSQNAEQTDVSGLATHMRTAAQMLAQLDASGAKRPRLEVESIKAKIIASMQNLEEQSFVADDPTQTATFDTLIASAALNGPQLSEHDFVDMEQQAQEEEGPNTGRGAARMENDQKTGGVQRKGDRDDPSAATFGEDWLTKKERIRRSSPYGWMKNWDLLSLIVKTGSDLRQELFACQLIKICAKIWEEANVPVWLKEMRILVTGESSGLIETITNGVSLHSLKRSLTLSSIAAGTNPRKRFMTLKDHFIKTFGEVDSPSYKTGTDAFMRSLAAYSIISYILQLKDRHNGNLLIDNQGHIIHIDFGFMLSNSPGSVGFEAAPFKLTYEYADVLGGVESSGWEEFRSLCKQAFQALRKSAENIVSVVELMSKESKMACFTLGSVATTNALRQRFMLQLSREEAENFVDNDLIAKSLGSYYTRLYDTYQYRTQGIY